MSVFRDTFVIGRRELLERIRSKWFVAMTLLGPVFMVALVVVPSVIAVRGIKGARVEIIDLHGELGQPIAEALRGKDWVVTIVPPTTPPEVELERIRRDEINGYLLIPRNAVTPPTSSSFMGKLNAVLGGSTIVYAGDNASAVDGMLSNVVEDVVLRVRARTYRLSDVQRDAMLADVQVISHHSTGEALGASAVGSFLVAYLLAIILYMVITIYGVAVMRSVVQEKTSRVMEFLVAVVKPQSLMAGKILGVGGAALIQLVVWLGIGALALAYRTELLDLFGIQAAGTALPPLAISELTVIVVYFLLGFFFYAAMYAAVGVMVSSEQDTQQVQMPVTMLLVIGVMCFQVISSNPRGSIATAMTLIPLWSPLLMPMRYFLGGATPAEVALSLAILMVSTIVVVRVAAKIYRVGVLMYGKRPTLGELVRWVRY